MKIYDDIKKAVKQFFVDRKARKAQEAQEKEIQELITHVKDNSMRIVYKTVLNNMFEYIKREQVAHSVSKCKKCGAEQEDDRNANGLNKVLPKIAVYTLDGLQSTFKFVGVQPMNGPVGLLYSIQLVEPKDEPTDGVRKMSLEVVSQAIEAGSRKLQAGWTIEAMQDLDASHGLDLENEIAKAIGQEVVEEIINEIFGDIAAMSPKSGTLRKYKSLDKYSDNLLLLINKASNEIAATTRRGSGNVLVTNYLTAAHISKVGKSFVEATDEEKEVFSNTPLQLVGVLNSNIQVFSRITTNPDIIIGYKGGNGEIDTGYFYCPYIALMSSGIIRNPENNFQPFVGLMTRYGKSVVNNGENYYRTITVNPFCDEVELLEE